MGIMEEGSGSPSPNTMDLDDENIDVNDVSDLPSSLIITNVDIRVFTDEDSRKEFEEAFRGFDPDVAVQYFKSFRRARVNFTTPEKAAKARIHCHELTVGNSVISCYFAQVAQEEDTVADKHLKLPEPVKQYLISPPASPPVGWEPVTEAQPMINYDLLTALANLVPGESHELHPPSEFQPGIVVHPCDVDDDAEAPRVKIQQTRCPDRKEMMDQT